MRTVTVSEAKATSIRCEPPVGHPCVDLDGRRRRMLATLRVAELPVTFDHAAHVARLPELHRDPFDRMLIAQAVAEDLTIVSRDRAFEG